MVGSVFFYSSVAAWIVLKQTLKIKSPNYSTTKIVKNDIEKTEFNPGNGFFTATFFLLGALAILLCLHCILAALSVMLSYFDSLPISPKFHEYWITKTTTSFELTDRLKYVLVPFLWTVSINLFNLLARQSNMQKIISQIPYINLLIRLSLIQKNQRKTRPIWVFRIFFILHFPH